MATSIQNFAPPFSCHYTSSLPSLSQAVFPLNYAKKKKLRDCRAMVQQTQAQGGAFAKEMERLSAKESLLLALKDAGGFEAVITGRATDVQRIDVNERIICLERLNPTPRPTTYPGLPIWKVDGILSGLELEAQCSWLPDFYSDMLIRNGYGTAIAHVKLLNSIENKVVLSSKFSVEGPLRMKEEYVEGIFETPKVNEDTVPEQLRGAFGQAVSSLQRLPVPIRDAVSSGLKIPLGETFRRLIMISYLDEEILIARNTAGEPEVLTRLDPAPDPEGPEPTSESES